MMQVYAVTITREAREDIARTYSYKKMTIVYNLIDDVALIRRVMASGLVL
jgi:hypothetical protein